MPPVASSLRRCWARVIRVDVALGRAAGSRHRALGQRSEGAILVSASSPGDDVHANRKSRIICLGPGLPCRRNHSDRQNRQSQNAHRNLLRKRYNISAHIDLGQFTFSRQPASARRTKFRLSACHKADVTGALVTQSGRGAVARPAVQVQLVTRIHRGEWRRPSWPRKTPVMARGPG